MDKVQKQKIHKQAENQALGDHLSDYPMNKSFDEVLDLMIAGDDSVLIWQPFEDEDIEHLAKIIREAAEINEDRLIHAIKTAKKSPKLAKKDKLIEELYDALQALGKAVEHGDPQTIADTWIYHGIPALKKVR